MTMTLQECYKKLEGNYEGVLSRMVSDKLVEKFMLKFLDDKSYELLISAVSENNLEEAFRASHTIKGVCQNLGFDRLFKSSNQFTEILRNGGDIDKGLLEKVKDDYNVTVDAIKKYQSERI